MTCYNPDIGVDFTCGNTEGAVHAWTNLGTRKRHKTLPSVPAPTLQTKSTQALGNSTAHAVTIHS